MYFSKFPYIKYSFPDGKDRNIKNLSIRPAIIDRVKEYEHNLIPYYVKEGEMPDHIAYDKYNNSKYHWVIMMANDMLNLYTDWPKDTQQFSDYLSEKYRTQYTNNDSEITLTDLELQRFIEFTGTPKNNFQSFIIIDEKRDGITVDSEGALSESDTYVTIHPSYIELDPKSVEYPDLKFDKRKIKWNVFKERRNAFGHTDELVGDMKPISIYEEEFEINQEKRKIKVPRREVLNKIISEFPALMKQ